MKARNRYLGDNMKNCLVTVVESTYCTLNAHMSHFFPNIGNLRSEEAHDLYTFTLNLNEDYM